MLAGNEKVKTAKFTFYSEERFFNGKFEKKEMLIKLQSKPKKVYMYSVTPDAGTEIIWKEGWNDNKMLIGPGSFPYVTFSLGINSSLARKDSHHSIRNMGFDYVARLVKYYLDVYGEKFYSFITVADTVNWDNHSCIILKFDFKDYKEINYTVKKDESITDIAERYQLNDYAILIINPSINDYHDVKEDQVIKIPNFYSRKIEFYIDRVNYLPLKQLIYDKNGLYEKYEMKSFRMNPVIKDEEFDPKYKEYGF
jgi:outer membrane lipoprotein-sorting protein